MTWNDAETSAPLNASVCVVLTRDSLGLWERTFAQYSNGRWSYTGSDAEIRGVRFWFRLPSLPLPTVEIHR